MTTFNTASALLNKRCDYIEERLSHPSELAGKAPAGKQYKHFVLQGVDEYRRLCPDDHIARRTRPKREPPRRLQ